VTEAEIRKLFPFEYSGGGYFRLKGVPKGEPAKILHGEEAIKFLAREVANALAASQAGVTRPPHT